jgi:hypothetical protein
MKTVPKSLIAAGLFAAFIAAPAAAQQKAVGLGVHGAWFQSGALAENSGTELNLDNKAAIGGGLEWWFGSRRVGLRADMTHTDAPFQIEFDNDANPDADAAQDELDEFGTVDTWFYNASLMIRLLAAEQDRRFAPFISLGGGFITWDTENEEVEDLRLEEVDAQIYRERQSEGAVFGSIGTDIFFTPSVALRLEAKDYFNLDSPYLMLSTLNGERDHHGGTHNILWTAGLQFMFGGGQVDEPGFISAAPEPTPAPAPAPAPEPAPPPAPTTESVAMCYVDQNGRLQTVSATRNLSNNNIYVSQNGQEVMFSTAYPATEPSYARNASWYVASRPLIIDLSNGDVVMTADADASLPAHRLEFVNFGSTQPIASADLVYVGSVDGTPFYARTSDVGAFQSDLDTRLRVSSDLGVMMEDSEFADRYVNEIQTFYVPLEPGSENCVFQPVTSTHVVRRTRG